MRRPALITLPLALAGLALAAASPAAVAAAPPDHGREHQRIVSFWTVDKVRQAKPRDFVGTPGGGFHLDPQASAGQARATAGKPSGGGSTAVLGSSWTGGGAVVKTTGKVLFSMGTSYYVCSASVVKDTASARSVALTAGHCVFDETTKKFAENWMFVPDYDSAPATLTADKSFCAYTTYGCWTPIALVAHSGFTTASEFNLQATLHDWGFVALGPGGKANPATQLVEDVTGVQPFDIAATGTTVNAFGYPAGKPYSGNDLTYCRGTLTTDPYNGGQTWGVGCKMTGGSSGGPWFAGFSDGSGTGTQMSVNSYGYKGVTTMFGPKFNDETQATYDAAQTAMINTDVGASPTS